MSPATKPYRLGVIGFAHMHVIDLIRTFGELPNVTWVACADTVPAVPSLSRQPGTRAANLAKAREMTGVTRVYDDYRAMLEREEMDIVIICAENSRHAEVVEAVARRGAHMVVEKPMATSLGEAKRMVAAARAGGVSLAVNWPTTWMPAVRKAHELVARGEIGDVWELRWRNWASLGPFSYGQTLSDEEKAAEWWYRASEGGGAFWDYCCYGACLARWFMGGPGTEAVAVKGNFFSPFGDVDDHAAMIVRFPRGMAVIEGTWATFHFGESPGQVLYGSAGTLVMRDGRALVYKNRKSAEPTAVYEGDPLPAGRHTIAHEFVHHLERGEPLHPTLDPVFNLEAMAMLDAAARSLVSGRVEPVAKGGLE